MQLDEFLSKLNQLIGGTASEDEIMSLLEELKADKEKALALQSKRVKDFFNRTDTNTVSEEEKEIESEETVTTEPVEETKSTPKIDDLFTNEEDVKYIDEGKEE